MNRETREELNRLSKEAFGSSSKWQKLVNNGVLEGYERDREVMVPMLNGGVGKKTFTDKKSVLKRYTIEEVRTLMAEILEKQAAQKLAFDALVHPKPGADLTETLLDGTIHVSS